MRKKDTRVEFQTGYVLHSYPYRETSLILEVYTEHYGRVSMVARGARRPGAAIRGVLQPFQPLTFSWFGASELKTLHQAEWQGGLPALTGSALVCGYYLNELLLGLIPKEDSIDPALFIRYQDTVAQLMDEKRMHSALRYFELGLLQCAGYGVSFEPVTQGLTLSEGGMYCFRYMTGVVTLPNEMTPYDFRVSGDLLLALQGRMMLEKGLRKEARAFLGWLLKWAMPEGQALYSQKLMKRLRDFQSVPLSDLD